MHANVKDNVSGWALEIKRRYPLTSPLKPEDVKDWEAEIVRMVGHTDPGEISETIRWAAYKHGNDRPATPQDLVSWIRERRFEAREQERNAGLTASNADRNEAAELCAQVIREWLMARGSKGYEDGYRRLGDDELIEPTDEFWSGVYNQWTKVGDGCMRYKHMRRARY